SDGASTETSGRGAVFPASGRRRRTRLPPSSAEQEANWPLASPVPLLVPGLAFSDDLAGLVESTKAPGLPIIGKPPRPKSGRVPLLILAITAAPRGRAWARWGSSA